MANKNQYIGDLYYRKSCAYSYYYTILLEVLT